MTAAAATRVLALLQGARRPAAFSAAAAATAARPAAALRSVGSGRLAPLAQRLGALHGAAVVCSASAGDGAPPCTRRSIAKSTRLQQCTHTQPPSPCFCCCLLRAGLLEVTLKVDGMVCEGCSGRVEETLQKMAGVKRVRAVFASSAASWPAAPCCDALTRCWHPGGAASSEEARQRAFPLRSLYSRPPLLSNTHFPGPDTPQVHVDLEKGLATVGVEAGMEEKIGAAAKTLAEAVRELGFDAEPQLAA